MKKCNGRGHSRNFLMPKHAIFVRMTAAPTMSSLRTLRFNFGAVLKVRTSGEVCGSICVLFNVFISCTDRTGWRARPVMLLHAATGHKVPGAVCVWHGLWRGLWQGMPTRPQFSCQAGNRPLVALSSYFLKKRYIGFYVVLLFFNIRFYKTWFWNLCESNRTCGDQVCLWPAVPSLWDAGLGLVASLHFGQAEYGLQLQHLLGSSGNPWSGGSLWHNEVV